MCLFWNVLNLKCVAVFLCDFTLSVAVSSVSNKIWVAPIHGPILPHPPWCSVTSYPVMQCYWLPSDAVLPVYTWCSVTSYPMMQCYQLPHDAVLPVTPWCSVTRYPLMQCYQIPLDAVFSISSRVERTWKNLARIRTRSKLRTRTRIRNFENSWKNYARHI